MLTFLFGLPGSLKVGLIALLAAGGLWLGHRRTVDRLEGELQSAREAVAVEQLRTAHTQAALDAVTGNRDRLQAEIERQNNAIALLAARGKQMDAESRAAVARALRDGEARAAALLTLSPRLPPGHAAMNAWMVARFGGTNATPVSPAARVQPRLVPREAAASRAAARAHPRAAARRGARAGATRAAGGAARARARTVARVSRPGASVRDQRARRGSGAAVARATRIPTRPHRRVARLGDGDRAMTGGLR